MSSSARTVRFSDLVKHFGPAHQVTLWSDPKTDKTFMRAVEENRVVTVALHNVGTRKDVGEVGFHPKPSATYIVFSKPLSAANGTKVVGLKYDLIEELPVTDPAPQSELQPKPKIRPRPPEPEIAVSSRTDTDKKVVEVPASVLQVPEQKRPKKFRVTVEVTAKSRVEKEIEAANAKEARVKALEVMKKDAMDVTNAAITHRVIDTKEVS